MNRYTEILARTYEQFESDDWEDENSKLESQHLEPLYQEYVLNLLAENLEPDTPLEFLEGLNFLNIFKTSEDEREELIEEFDWELE